MAESEEVTRGEILQIVFDHAFRNRDYLRALLKDPRAVLSRQMGQSIPPSLNVEVVQDTFDTMFLVAPRDPADTSLSDADLEHVAGGLMKTSRDRKVSGDRYTCTVPGGIGTRNEIQIDAG